MYFKLCCCIIKDLCVYDYVHLNKCSFYDEVKLEPVFYNAFNCFKRNSCKVNLLNYTDFPLLLITFSYLIRLTSNPINNKLSLRRVCPRFTCIMPIVGRAPRSCVIISGQVASRCLNIDILERNHEANIKMKELDMSL